MFSSLPGRVARALRTLGVTTVVVALLLAACAAVSGAQAPTFPAMPRIPGWAAMEPCAKGTPSDSLGVAMRGATPDSARYLEAVALPSEWPTKAWVQVGEGYAQRAAGGMRVYCLGYIVRVASPGKPVRYDYYSPSLTRRGSYVVRWSLPATTLYWDRAALVRHFLGATLTP